MAEDTVDTAGAEKRAIRRKIPGGLPYTGSPGVLQRVLEKIPITEKPSIFSIDFLGTVLDATGGASRPIIPIMKAANLLSQSGAPTELYAQFQTEGGRAEAALQAMRNAFPEIFKRNQFANRADEKTLTDIVVSITGLPRNDKIVRNILATFQVFQGFASTAVDSISRFDVSDSKPAQDFSQYSSESGDIGGNRHLGLVYNINIALPETTNVEVYDAIFRSLRGNLLQ